MPHGFGRPHSAAFAAMASLMALRSIWPPSRRTSRIASAQARPGWSAGSSGTFTSDRPASGSGDLDALSAHRPVHGLQEPVIEAPGPAAPCGACAFGTRSVRIGASGRESGPAQYPSPYVSLPSRKNIGISDGSFCSPSIPVATRFAVRIDITFPPRSMSRSACSPPRSASDGMCVAEPDAEPGLAAQPPDLHRLLHDLARPLRATA